MKHIKTYEAAGERLFRALEGEGVSGYVGHKCRLWINKLTLKSLLAHRVEGLSGTDPVSLKQAMRFLDLAYDALGTKPEESGVTVEFIFSRPGRPAEQFYQIGGAPNEDSKSQSIDKITRLISEMGADIHLVSVSKHRRHYNPNKISMYFLVDDWVQLFFKGSVIVETPVTAGLAMTTTKKYRCDWLEGVRQCLGSLNISR